jgi:hypothetical protein
MSGDPRFRETQRFRQGWLWAFLLVTNVQILFLLGVILADEYEGFPRSDTNRRTGFARARPTVGSDSPR